jgi:hypothetical protein
MSARAGRYDQVWLTTYGNQEIAVTSLGQVKVGTATAPDQYIARFGEAVFLIEADLEPEAGGATVKLEWRYLDELPQATVFRHILDCRGQMLGQGDGLPLGGTLPFRGLTPGSEILDTRQIELDQPASQGCHTLSVGLYLPDGSRLEAHGEGGERLVDDAARIGFGAGSSVGR